jgi:hypothetical protein
LTDIEKGDALIKSLLHTDPEGLCDEDWATGVNQSLFIMDYFGNVLLEKISQLLPK